MEDETSEHDPDPTPEDGWSEDDIHEDNPQDDDDLPEGGLTGIASTQTEPVRVGVVANEKRRLC